MPSILESVFRNTCKSKRRVTGDPEVDIVYVNGKIYEDALVEILSASEMFVADGKAESGGFKCSIPVCDFVTPPKKFDPISCRDMSLKILSIDDVNGILYSITAGDPISET
jgi:hypothetical protein